MYLEHFPTAAGRRSKNARFASVCEHNLTHLMLLFSGRFGHVIASHLEMRQRKKKGIKKKAAANKLT
jgi:hypothetical protein